jgi:hypothetical protein
MKASLVLSLLLLWWEGGEMRIGWQKGRGKRRQKLHHFSRLLLLHVVPQQKNCKFAGT